MIKSLKEIKQNPAKKKKKITKNPRSEIPKERTWWDLTLR